ncbi:MAG: hypothetical protein U5J64_10875 [Halobacteriales archaeon]|nr:hypothetical protein [Halobacteriales archaeon]
MILVRGNALGTSLTGTVYEPDDEPPEYRGAPETDAPYVWVCDGFYEVESGGTKQRVGGEEIRVAFESPTPKGYKTVEDALEGAAEHIRTQFSRIGVDSDEVSVEVVRTP